MTGATLKLERAELISLLNIYSQREAFHIGLHHTRANYFMWLVSATLAFTFLAYARGKDDISAILLSLVPLVTIGLCEVARLSLKRTYDRVNSSLMTRQKIEQLLGLHMPTPTVPDEGSSYFPGEPIRPVDSDYLAKLRQMREHGKRFEDWYAGAGQQKYLLMMFRVAEAMAFLMLLFILGAKFGVL